MESMQQQKFSFEALLLTFFAEALKPETLYRQHNIEPTKKAILILRKIKQKKLCFIR